MIPANTYAEIVERLSETFVNHNSITPTATRLTALLFARPDSSFAREQIVTSFPHFDVRSGPIIDFFLIGYGGYWTGAYADKYKDTVRLAGSDKMFSYGAFNEVRDEIERKTKWKYSGSSDLILLNTHFNTGTQQAEMDFSAVVALDLEKAVALKMIDSVERYFERIFRLAENEDVVDKLKQLRKSDDVKFARGFLLSFLYQALKNLPVLGKLSEWSQDESRKILFRISQSVGKD